MAHPHLPKKLKVPWYQDWLLLPVIGIIYLLDQVTKYWAEENLCPSRSIPEEGSFRLTCTYNTGTAFGLFPDQTILLIIASFIGMGVLLLVYRHQPFPSPWLRLSLGMQLGGAIGNLTDRLRFGQVTDFVQLAWWPVFNLADASIVIGIIILIAVFILSGDKDEKKAQDTDARLQTEPSPPLDAGPNPPPAQPTDSPPTSAPQETRPPARPTDED
ncbi:MAG: signal peptidase II [SAR202 cluster bacterium]|nr:signal peptidase II [SAR202 cluster bacterium]